MTKNDQKSKLICESPNISKNYENGTKNSSSKMTKNLNLKSTKNPIEI